MSSCNKTFKQVLSIFFKSDLRFSCTLDSTLNLSEIRRTVSELVKMLLEPFSNLPNWIYIYIKYHIKALHFFKYSKLNIYKKKHWIYSLFLQRQYFRLRLNMVHLHRVSTQMNYLIGFFHIHYVFVRWNKKSHWMFM